MVNEHSSASARFEVSRPDDTTIAVALGGAWTVRGHLPALAEVTTQIDATPAIRRITFDSRDLGEWDTGLLTFILGLIRHAKAKDIAIDPSGLPKGLLGLIDMAKAVPAREGTAEKRTRRSFLRILGDATLDFASGTGRLMAFIGEAAMSLFRFATGRARFRRSDMWLFIEQAGVDALPIVSLLSLLQGLTMAFLGAAQLRMFGAQIYVANLIGMSMAAEVGAVMTAIIMAGRTGAAYAAQIGTMQVNQEIDALQTMGLEPMDFLVLPRMLALIAMMPLLYLYANLLGMFGGGVIAVLVLGITPEQFLNQLFAAVPLSVFVTGLIKSAVFGILVALSGCMQGINCGRSAAAVGDATTSAVVMAIVAIIVGDGSVDGEPLITGYIDVVMPFYSADEHGVNISGRDRSGDLIDCSAAVEPGEWHDIGLAALVAAIAKPFGIDVYPEAGLDLGAKFPRFRIQPGETAFAAIERATRARAVLAVARLSKPNLPTPVFSARR